MKLFLALRAEALRQLAVAARDVAARSDGPEPGWVHAAVSRVVPPDHAEPVAAEILRLLGGGMQIAYLAELLDTLAAAQDSRATVEDRVDLVWTGPEGAGTASRDTAVVVREAFGRAESSVLVAGYVIYRGQEVFASLARRMTDRPNLRVRFFLNVERGRGDTSIASEIVRRFARRFREEQWPGDRLPEVFYDPRALELDAGRRAVLHAKCIVIDGVIAFVSSANFTPAAQVKNIEAGALIRSPSFAASLEGHFESLVDEGVLVPVL
jgi:phosphatidylserine/phosphatidylglycerophosphate/cardiolipin synthase-like enzyme